MTALAFDRSKLTRTLQHEAKLSPHQSEIVADIVLRAQRADLATEADVSASVTILRSEIKAQLAGTRFDLTRTLAGFLALQTLIVLSAILGAASILKP